MGGRWGHLFQMSFLLLACKRLEGTQREFSYLFLSESESWQFFFNY